MISSSLFLQRTANVKPVSLGVDRAAKSPRTVSKFFHFRESLTQAGQVLGKGLLFRIETIQFVHAFGQRICSYVDIWPWGSGDVLEQIDRFFVTRRQSLSLLSKTEIARLGEASRGSRPPSFG